MNLAFFGSESSVHICPAPSHSASTCYSPVAGVLSVEVTIGCVSLPPVVRSIQSLCVEPAAPNLRTLQEHKHTWTSAHARAHIPTRARSCVGEKMSAVFLPEVPSHIRPALIIKGRGVRVDPLSVQLRAGDPLIHSSGFVWASGLTHLPTPQASARPWSEGRLLFSSNNCS